MLSKFIIFLRHAFALIREDKLFSAIYVVGTAVAIASAMVIAIVLNIMLANIPPETHRDRMLYPTGVVAKTNDSDGAYYAGFSMLALDSCFKQMQCVEAATAFIPAVLNRFTIEADSQPTSTGWQEQTTYSVMAADHEFFRVFDFDFVSGRPFSKQEFRSGERVCVLVDKVWEKLSRPSNVDIQGLPHRVVGVVRAVSALMNATTADAYVSYLSEGLFPRPYYAPNEEAGKSYQGSLAARILLRRGCSRQDFLEELSPLISHYNAIASSEAGEQVEWVVRTDTHFFRTMHFFNDERDMQDFQHQALNLMPPALLMLLFLLLPAINLSGLVSNRMEARRAEMGIRKAFGAKRRTLLREVINENLVLTLCGGAVGWLLSWLFIVAIRGNKVFLELFLSRDQNVTDIGLQLQMFFTPTLFLIVFVCCVLLNLMAALLPAWHSLRKPIVESLNQKR